MKLNKEIKISTMESELSLSAFERYSDNSSVSFYELGFPKTEFHEEYSYKKDSVLLQSLIH